MYNNILHPFFYISQEFGRIMKNPIIINEEKQRFSDIYPAAILKYGNVLEREHALIKNCLASLKKGISMEIPLISFPTN